MRTDLDHLPPAKQRQLERVVQILFEEFEEAIGRATQDWKRKGRILKIILYGSYARGSEFQTTSINLAKPARRDGTRQLLASNLRRRPR